MLDNVWLKNKEKLKIITYEEFSDRLKKEEINEFYVKSNILILEENNKLKIKKKFYIEQNDLEKLSEFILNIKDKTSFNINDNGFTIKVKNETYIIVKNKKNFTLEVQYFKKKYSNQGGFKNGKNRNNRR